MKFCVLVVIQVLNQNISAEVDNKQVLIVQQAALNGNSKSLPILFSFRCQMLEQLITLGQMVVAQKIILKFGAAKRV